LVQELSKDDFDRRIKFCKKIIQKVNEPAFLSKIVFFLVVFLDELTSELSKHVNRHNCRY